MYARSNAAAFSIAVVAILLKQQHMSWQAIATGVCRAAPHV